MSDFKHALGLEQWVTYARWIGVLLAAVLVPLRSGYPGPEVEAAAWGLTAILALGNLTIWGAIGRIGTEPAQQRLGRAAFVFDGLVIMGYVWLYAHEDPYLIWAVLFVLPLEGALRYRMRGALASLAGVAVFFVPQTFHVAQIHSAPFDISTYAFVVGVTALIATTAATMAENWHRREKMHAHQSTQLAELDRLKDRYLAVTTHEIRGPLTAIMTGVDTIRKRRARLSPERQDEMLDMVSQQSRQLARLVDDLMLSSELQGRSLALQLEWLELEAVIDQALGAADAKRRAHQLEVFVEPVRCEVDGHRVAQITRNLVENAYKYTPDRTRIAVTARATAGGILIEVLDDGPGIPAEQRDQLFEAFSRIQETAAGREGVGLGLYVVSQLVAVMEGRLDLASSSKGTTFTIHIPCNRQPPGRPQMGLVSSAEDDDIGSALTEEAG
ncbi:MAG: sensor histidine kinase [Actinomycetota bacterium]